MINCSFNAERTNEQEKVLQVFISKFEFWSLDSLDKRICALNNCTLVYIVSKFIRRSDTGMYASGFRKTAKV